MVSNHGRRAADAEHANGTGASNGNGHAAANAKAASSASSRRGSEDPPNHHPALSSHDVLRVSVEGMVDPRGVLKYLHGMRQTPLSRARVERGLRACGLEHLIGYATRTAAAAATQARQDGKSGKA